MKVTTSKSKNSESFYITQSYINSNGKSTSKRIRKLGTLKELTQTLGTDRDGVMAWAREQAWRTRHVCRSGMREVGFMWNLYVTTPKRRLAKPQALCYHIFVTKIKGNKGFMKGGLTMQNNDRQQQSRIEKPIIKGTALRRYDR